MNIFSKCMAGPGFELKTQLLPYMEVDTQFAWFRTLKFWFLDLEIMTRPLDKSA